MQLAGGIDFASGDDVCSLTRKHDAKTICSASGVARAVPTVGVLRRRRARTTLRTGSGSLLRLAAALSASIAKLERELNVTLINRGHNYKGLTPEGERLVVWAKRILAEQEAFKAEVAAVQSGISGTLRLGTEPTASTTQALPVAAFCAAHPLAKVQVDSRLSTTKLCR